MKHTNIQTSFASGTYAITRDVPNSDILSMNISGHNFDVKSEFTRAEAMDLALQILISADPTPDEIKKITAHLKNNHEGE
ncbi:MAG TPA: hypothetical protein VFA55_04000 [Candidatus Kapabacteria bacterium]|nr:hypothetical protein [Candidatus Kapabacteria bacterium]